MKLQFMCVSAGIHPNDALFQIAKPICCENAKRYQRYFCSPLSIIAEVPEDCDRFLKHIADIENGVETEIETGANDVVLTFRPSGVQVDILINDDWCDQPDGHFELREWKIALDGWRRFLAMPKSLESIVEVTL